MMLFNVVELSRLQFAFTAMYHYIFVPFSIGLGVMLVVFETMYIITRKPEYENMTRFWIKLFAATFSMGVATGIVLEFEFGTNWATYSRFVGDVFGSPLAAEGVFAFFLESGFLAVLLFGWGRVKPWFHWFSTVMVSFGSVLSAFWIIAANSWQQTPVAYTIVGHGSTQRAVITDFFQMVFNPSTMVRFQHSVVGAIIQGTFFVMSVSAYYLIKNKHTDMAKKSFALALMVAAVASLGQLLIGHEHGEVVAKYQPAKLAAFEGLYHTQTEAPLVIIGHTDPKTQTTTGIKIPGMLSYLSYGDTKAEVKGLNHFKPEDRPSVTDVFHSYHIMVALGMFFIGFTLFALFLLWRKRLFNQKWLMYISMFGVILPVIANQLGWYSAERGRQPWVVYNLLRTSDAASKSVNAPEVLTSFIMFALIYALLFFVFIYVLDREIKHGPENHEHEPELRLGGKTSELLHD